MKIISYIIIIVSLFSFCLNENNKVFEGVISFDLSYTDIDEKVLMQTICALSGDSVSSYHNSKGDLQLSYCKGEIVSTSWFDSGENKLYFHPESMDTLFFYSSSISDFNAYIEKTNEFENILEYKCQKFIVTLIPRSGRVNDTIRYEYFIAKDLKIDFNTYKNFKEGGYNELLSMMPGISLKQIFYGKFYTRTKKATRIEKRSINLNDYKTKEKLPIKELNIE